MSGKHETHRYWYAGLLVSGSLHLGLVLGLATCSLFAWPWFVAIPSTSSAQPLTFVSAPAEESRQAAVAPPAENADPSMPEYLRQKLRDAVDESQAEDDNAKLEKLRKLSSRLDRVASSDSVDNLSLQLRQWFGTEERADRPVESPAGSEFDYRTAQLHDVRRIEAEDGSWTYRSVLVDAQGRAVEVSMDAEQGSRLYQTFQLIKSNPLLERVYRQFIMGFLDQWMREAEVDGSTEVRPVESKVEAKQESGSE
ncbi:MAG: hypothetical protein FJ295_05415 [Planctomycetes bacterium]|nr:hypothetical protein [Planctomycetota bacterium]